MRTFVKCFPFGNLIRLTAAFSGPTGSPPEVAAIDPDAVTVRIKDPSGTKTAFVYLTDDGVIRDATGLFHYDIDASAAGTWTYRWEGTGAAQAAQEATFTVGPSAFEGSP